MWPEVADLASSVLKLQLQYLANRKKSRGRGVEPYSKFSHKKGNAAYRQSKVCKLLIPRDLCQRPHIHRHSSAFQEVCAFSEERLDCAYVDVKHGRMLSVIAPLQEMFKEMLQLPARGVELKCNLPIFPMSYYCRSLN